MFISRDIISMPSSTIITTTTTKYNLEGRRKKDETQKQVYVTYILEIFYILATIIAIPSYYLRSLKLTTKLWMKQATNPSFQRWLLNTSYVDWQKSMSGSLQITSHAISFNKILTNATFWKETRDVHGNVRVGWLNDVFNIGLWMRITLKWL